MFCDFSILSYVRVLQGSGVFQVKQTHQRCYHLRFNMYVESDMSWSWLRRVLFI